MVVFHRLRLCRVGILETLPTPVAGHSSRVTAACIGVHSLLLLRTRSFFQWFITYSDCSASSYVITDVLYQRIRISSHVRLAGSFEIVFYLIPY